ncbi:hypothetical protein J2W28_004459 [Variovorax boronicumulans]|nr:hypothetical protein [Variovorax boronicumulans]MDQ0005297.1 hypothetical protein [Variovorax boronicumulans]
MGELPTPALDCYTPPFKYDLIGLSPKCPAR